MSVRAPVGALNVAQASCCIGRGLAAIKGIAVEQDYLYWALQYSVSQLRRVSQGSTFDSINKDHLSRLRIPTPTQIEQRKISAILSSVDDAIEATQHIIDQTEVVKRSIMQKLLTKGIADTTFKNSEIGEIPLKWELLTIDELGSEEEPVLRTGPFGSSLKSEHYTKSGVPVVNIFNLSEGFINTESLFYVSPSKAEELANYRLKCNHIVFSRVADIGRSVVIPISSDGWIMSSNLMRISVNPKVIQPQFFYYSLVHSPLVTKQVQRGVNNAGRDTITSNTLKSLLFPVPPFEEQSRISAAIKVVEQKKRSEEAYLMSLNKVKNSLLQALLTGKVRVNIDEPTEVLV